MQTRETSVALPRQLLVVGSNGSGKSVVARTLQRALSLEIVEFGQRVRSEQASDASLPRDSSSAFLTLRHRYGAAYLLNCAKEQSDLTGRGAILVGVRDIESYESMRRALPRLVTLAVVAPKEVRRFRDQGRHRPPYVGTFEQRDRLHEAWGLSDIIRSATFRFDNAGSIAELEKLVLSAAATIRSRP